MKIPQLKDFFSLQPFKDRPAGTTTAESEHLAQWQKIRFDNTVRAWIAIPSYLACYVLAARGVIPSVMPMTWVFSIYAVLQLLITSAFMNSRHGRTLDFVFASLDVAAMSLSVYFTGGMTSPLYFVYFIPLVIHAFHRDSRLVVFSGFGGVVFYAFAVSQPMGDMSSAMVANIAARLFFMLLTVSIACLALAFLKKQDAVDELRILRLNNLTLVSEALNHMTTLSERPKVAARLIQLMDEGLGPKLEASSHIVFDDLNTPLNTDDRHPAGSKIKLAVNGAENETFGELVVESPRKNAFGADELSFLEFVAMSLGLSIQRLHRMEELRKSLEMNSWVMAANIASSRSTKETYTAVLDGIMTILGADAADLSILLPTVHNYQTVMGRGGKIADDQASVFPLKNIKGDELGIIRATRRVSTEKISDIDMETATTFATRAALSIENAIAHEQQREKLHLYVEDANRKKAA